MTATISPFIKIPCFFYVCNHTPVTVMLYQANFKHTIMSYKKKTNNSLRMKKFCRQHSMLKVFIRVMSDEMQ